MTKSGLALRLLSPALAAAPDLVDTISQDPPRLLRDVKQVMEYNDATF